MDDPSLIVEGNMRDDEKDKLMERILLVNPSFSGANVSDVISEAHDADAFVEITEELWELAYASEYPEASIDFEAKHPGLCGTALTSIAMVYGVPATEFEPNALGGILHRLTKTED
jgi:hypothetical protein